MILRRIVSVLIIFTVVLSSSIMVFADSENSEKYEIIELKTRNDIHVVGNADIFRINSEVAINAEKKELKELLDKADISVIDNINQEAIIDLADKIDAYYCIAELEEGQKTIGAVIKKTQEGSFKISEVIAEVADKMVDDKIIRTDKDSADMFLNWLSNNATIDIDLIYNDYKDSLTKLRAASIANGYFGDDSVFMYLYSAPNQPNYTEYLDHNDSSRYKLATVKVSIYGYNNKTSGSTTYDSFTAEINVAPRDSLKVYKFNGNLYTADNSRYDIKGATYLQSDSGSTQTFTINLPQSITSLSGSLSYSYTYNTGGKDIVNRVLYEQYKNRWKVTPISPAKGESFNIVPSMVIKVTNGTTKKNIARASLSYLKLKEMASAYWVTDKDVVIKLGYKNHQQVSVD